MPISSTTIQGDPSGSPAPISGTVTANIGTTNGLALDSTLSSLNAKVTTVNTGAVTISTALPAGTNVIGHIIADSGSTTAVTGNVTVVQGTGTNLHTVVDSGTVTANIGTTNGLALDATLTGGTQKTKLVDTGGTNVATISAAGALKVDGSAVTQPVSGTVTANAGTGTFAENLTQVGGASIALGQTTMASSLPVVIASNQSAIPVTLTSTTITGTVAVTQSTSPWVVSGTVTANIGTTNGLALDASVTGLQVSQGSTTSGQKGGLTLGAVTTAAPAYTTAQSSPLSLTTSGALRTDSSATTQPVSGTVTVTQATGTNLHTVLDSGTLTSITNALPAGTNVIGHVIADSGSTTAVTGNVTVVQATAANLNATVTGTVSITANSSVNLNQIGGNAVVTGGANGLLAVGGPVASGSANADNPLKIGGAFNTTQPTVTNGQIVDAQMTARGAQIVATGTDTFNVTANAGTNLNTSALALDTSVNGILVSQGSTTSGEKGPLVQGAVTTAVPTYTTGQTNPISLDTSGRTRVAPATPTDITASGTINALNGAVTATTNGTGSTVFQLTGVFVATFVAEGSVDNTNWTNLTIFPASGQSTTGGVSAVSSYRIPSTSGYAQIRVRCSAYTSGTATVQMNLSEVVGAPQIFSPNAQNCLVGASHVDGYKATYSAAITGLAMAATPTDVFTITGSATKTIRVTRIYLTGTQTTGNTSNVLLIRRSAANTLGTSTTPTVVQNDTNDAAGTAVVRAYTANPTLGATVGTMASYAIFIPAPQPANANSPFITPDLFAAIRPAEAIVLRGTTQVLAVNFNSVTVTGNAMNIFIEWTEE